MKMCKTCEIFALRLRGYELELIRDYTIDTVWEFDELSRSYVKNFRIYSKI